MILKVKKISPDAQMPTFGTVCSAGMDLYVSGYLDGVKQERGGYWVEHGGTTIIPLGVSVEIPDGYFGILVLRSSMGFKRGISLVNNVGIIDNDYRGELKLCVTLASDSFSAEEFIRAGERIAQLIILPMQYIQLKEVDELSDTERGIGGFGSTGI